MTSVEGTSQKSREKTASLDLRQLALFLLWPMLSLVVSIKNRNSSWAKNIFWLFCIYYGYTFIIFNENIDSFRYAQEFVSFGKLDLNLGNFIACLYSKETNYVDIVQPLVSFILSRFTSDSRVLFAVFGMIFGYFYSRNLWYLFEKIGKKKSAITGLYVLAFALVCPIWNINGFRFWTAAQVFLFGVFPYLMDGKRKGLWIAATSILIHFTFALPVIILLIYSLTGNRRTAFFALFIATIFINEINLETIKSSLDFLPDIFQARVNIYINAILYENQLKGVKELNWYMQYSKLFVKWIVDIFLLAVYLKGSALLKLNKGLASLFCFSLIFYSFCNIADLMPQGGRFYAIGNLLAFFLIIICLTHVQDREIMNLFKIIGAPLLLIVIVVSIRMGFDYTGLVTVFGNPFIAPFIKNDIPLINLIK